MPCGGSLRRLSTLLFLAFPAGAARPCLSAAQDSPASEPPAPPSAAAQPIQHSSAWLGLLGDSWRALDDPGAASLPAVLRELPGKREALFESLDRRSLMLVRRLPQDVTGMQAFMGDEQVMSRRADFLPLADREVQVAGGGALSFDCEWTEKSLSARVAALYAPLSGGEWLGLWIASTGDAPFEEWQAELEGALQRFEAGVESALSARYSAVLNEHEISFELGPRDVFSLRPVEQVDGEHADIVQQILEVNPQFKGAPLRQWSDEPRGLTFSYQTIVNDVTLGPASPFVHWLAGQFQRSLRGDPDLGDVPLELIHLEQARSEVIGDEALQQHYKNCERTAGAGVILEVYLPRSPYARVCRLSWEQDTPEGRPSQARMWFVELRHYHLSRGEMVTAAGIVVLRAQARSREDLDLFEDALHFTSCPLQQSPAFPAN